MFFKSLEQCEQNNFIKKNKATTFNKYLYFIFLTQSYNYNFSFPTISAVNLRKI